MRVPRWALLVAVLLAASEAGGAPHACARRGAFARRCASRASGAPANEAALAPAELRARAADALRGVTYDALGPLALLAGSSANDVISLGLVDPSELQIRARDGSALLALRTRAPEAPAVVALAAACERALVDALGVPLATVERALLPTPAESGQSSPGLAQVSHVVAVGSCKGGVGKSTTAVNLAFALAALGARVGLVDVDIYGPSLPTMVTPESTEMSVIGSAILPLERDGVRLMSIGWVNPHSMMLRGAKIAPLVEQMVGQTAWGPLDFLVVDLPPGTGDVQLALAQSIRVSGCVLVSTPQRLSFVDVVKGVELFQKVAIPTLAVVENMASYTPPAIPAERLDALCAKHGLSAAARADLDAELALCSTELRLFGGGHLQRLTEMWGINAAFSLPLLPSIARAGDSGARRPHCAPRVRASRAQPDPRRTHARPGRPSTGRAERATVGVGCWREVHRAASTPLVARARPLRPLTSLRPLTCVPIGCVRSCARQACRTSSPSRQASRPSSFANWPRRSSARFLRTS